MKKRGLVLTLAVLLTLTAGCGKKQEAAEAPSEEVSPDTVILTVDNREVPAWRYLYWLTYDRERITAQYRDAGLEPDWTAPAEDGGTLADYIQQQALADTALYATVENWADARSISPSEADLSALETQAANWAANSHFQCFSALGLGAPEALELLTDAWLYARMAERFAAGDWDPAPTEADITAFAEAENWLTLDWVRLTPGDGGQEACRTRAAEQFSRLNSGEDPSAVFSSLPEDLGSTGSQTFQTGTGVLPASIEEAALALEEGQWSGVLEDGGSCYLLLRQSLDTGAVTGAYFDHLLLSAAGSADITETDAFRLLDTRSLLETSEPSSKANSSGA